MGDEGEGEKGKNRAFCDRFQISEGCIHSRYTTH